MCTDDNFSGWESSLLEYRLQKPEFSRMDLCAEVLNDITVFGQCNYISTIPNYHKWFWKFEKNVGITYEQRFSSSCKRYPGSPRNRIVQAISFRAEHHLVVFAVIKTILGYPCEIPHKILKYIHLKRKNAENAKRKSKKVMRDCTSKNNDAITFDIGLFMFLRIQC